MSENEILPDDPRLTAYALGELDPTEQAEVERLLAESPTAQAALVEIRGVAGLLANELRQEPVPELTGAQRSAILVGHVAPVVALRSISRRATRWISRFAAMAAMVALVAVAAFLPAPGSRSRNQLTSEFFVNGELKDLQAGGQLDFALSEDFDHEIGAEVTSLSPLSRTPNGTVAASSLEMGATGSGGTESFSEMLTDRRGEELQSDGSARFAGGRKLKKKWNAEIADRKQGEKYDASHGDGQPGQGLLPGIGNRLAGNAPVNEQTESKPAGGPQSYNRPTSTSTESAKQSVQKESAKRHVRLNADLAQSAPLATAPVSDDGRSEGIDNGKHSTGKSVSSSSHAGARPDPDAGFKKPGIGGGGGGGGYGGGKGPQSARERDAKADKFTKQLSDLDESAEGYVADVEYPEAKKLQELERLRQKFKKDKEGGKIAGESRSSSGFQTATTDSFEFAQEHRRKLTESLLGTEAYEPIIENAFRSSYEDPLSTFGIDVDTASYANVRRFLTQQLLPPPNAVRIEELVNYFSYDYPQPAGDQPFSVNVEAGRCPWNAGNGLVRIGLKGREIDPDKRPVSNLVFLVDVSGSMQAENKLPLVKMGLNLLTQQMTESDRVAIVTYSDTAVQRLESTNGTNKPAIAGVINSLQAGGSTNGAGGIQLAYRAALDHFVAGGTNRVILCTDGDFNVGVTSDDELVKMIEERARTKVFFSVLGFGMGNLKDGKLEKLADKGNGQYAYIDSQREAKKVFVDDLAGTLVTIAKDVKIQVEFNPNQVGAYRLIGYENRVMASQDFNNDAKDAGDIGAGHTVTALYEILPAGEAPRPELGDSLRYRKAVVPQEGELARELLTVKLRYKLPEADKSTLVEVPIDDPRGLPLSELGNQAPAAARKPTSPDFNWATAVAAFGMILRDSQFRGQASFDMVLELAQGAKGEDKAGRRQEFIDLVKAAKALYGGGSPASDVVPVEPQTVPALTREQAEAKATVNGKYKNLLRIVEAPGDSTAYGAYHEYGRWEGTSYRDQNNLPVGYWVYVSPNWYIWGDVAQRE